MPYKRNTEVSTTKQLISACALVYQCLTKIMLNYHEKKPIKMKHEKKYVSRQNCQA